MTEKGQHHVEGIMSNDKRPWESKTIWFNLIVGLAAIAAVMGVDLGITEEAAGGVAEAIVLLIAAGGNVVLRFVTSEPLK